MIKAVFIDIDDTLLDFEKCSEEAINLAFEKRGIVPPRNILSVFLETGVELWRKMEDGTLDFEELQRIRFNIIFKKTNVDCDGEEFEADFRKNLANSAIPVEDAREILEYLSKKYIVFATSNSPQKQQETRLEKAQLSAFITEIMTSERIGFMKPDRHFFEGCMASLPGVLPEEIMMIGDTLNADIRGGRDSGLLTCWFNPKHVSPSKEIVPDFTVGSLLEIKNIL